MVIFKQCSVSQANAKQVRNQMLVEGSSAIDIEVYGLNPITSDYAKRVKIQWSIRKLNFIGTYTAIEQSVQLRPCG